MVNLLFKYKPQSASFPAKTAVPSITNDSIQSSPKTITSPSTETSIEYNNRGWGQQIIIDEKIEDQELLGIWENRRLNNISLNDSDIKKLGEANNIVTLQTSGNSSKYSDVDWKIQSKRNALAKIANYIAFLDKDQEKTKNIFVNVRLIGLKYLESEKSAIVRVEIQEN